MQSAEFSRGAPDPIVASRVRISVLNPHSRGPAPAHEDHPIGDWRA